MNGIIHNCTHGNNPDVRLTEDEMIVKIFTYLDKLFHIVKPQKLIFMAIDGVAPRAKMNQQRARRFKSAREAEEAVKKAEERGDPLPDPSTRFDSNCITPGTPFMARLSAHLRFFVRKKIAEDPAWQKPTVVFSGHDVPGEGEHKIMEYIRWAKKSPSFDANMRHCLYGLDADLIMLSLVTHEPHFCLLREVVSYGGGNRGQPSREVLENPCQEHFVLLQIGLLREYIDLEFKSLASVLPFMYDAERIIDDFVLFCMLVGNDFLPPLPTVDINEGSLDSMMDLYKDLLPKLGGYITHAGELHRARFEILLKALAEQEADVLEARAIDADEYDAKEEKKNRGKSNAEDPLWVFDSGKEPNPIENIGSADALEMARLTLQEHGHELELLALEEGDIDPAVLIEYSNSIAGPFKSVIPRNSKEPKEPEPEQGATMMSREARAFFADGDKTAGLAAWRKRYYSQKLLLEIEDQRNVVVKYIEGLHWVLEYYYRGVASWNWYYPYHYAPMASDCVDLQTINVKFSLGTPFKPYEQLLSVQPSSSCNLLPEPYRWLMLDPKSPIADFYPVDFKVDLEGKRADWEGVVLIPFIDERRLLAAAQSIPDSSLTKEERKRNTLGDMVVFSHHEGSDEMSFCESTLPTHFPSVTKSNSTASIQVSPPPLPSGEKGFVPKLMDGTRVGAIGPPGFPSLKTLTLSGALRQAGCNIFGMKSRKKSLVLMVKTLEDHLGKEKRISAIEIAAALVGHRTWVKWPYLQEAQVEAVTDGKVRAEGSGRWRPLAAEEIDDWKLKATVTLNEMLEKQGLDIGNVTFMLHVRACEGLIRQLDGTVEKRFSKQETAYPLQLTLRRNPSPDPRFEIVRKGWKEPCLFSELKPGAKALFLGRTHYGCLAEVQPQRCPVKTKEIPNELGSDKTQYLKDGGRTVKNVKERVGQNAQDKADLNSKKSEQLFSAGPPYCIKLHPTPSYSAHVGRTARRLFKSLSTEYSPSGQVARRLGMSPRTLGRITGSIWVKTGPDRRDRIDVGLYVKNAANELFVPDFCAPVQSREEKTDDASNNKLARDKNGVVKRGWAYSDALVRILEQYKQRFPFVIKALEDGNESERRDILLEKLFPGMDHDAALAQVSLIGKWLKTTSLARRPLVKIGSIVASDRAVQMLQTSLPNQTLTEENASNSSMIIELENVAAPLLLPPLDRGGPGTVFVGGTFDLADRVVAVGSGGTPPFGSRGTVTGVYDDGKTIEVLFDKPFLGGSDLNGRCLGENGAILPPEELLNLSKPHAIRAEGKDKPKSISGMQASKQQNVSRDRKKTSDAKIEADMALNLASASLQHGTPHSKGPLIPNNSGAKGFGMGRGMPTKNMMDFFNRSDLSSSHVNAYKTEKTSPGKQNGAQLLAQLRAQQPVTCVPVPPTTIPQAGVESKPRNPGNDLLQQLKSNVGGTDTPQDSTNPLPNLPNPGAFLLQKLKEQPDGSSSKLTKNKIHSNRIKQGEAKTKISEPKPPPVPSASMLASITADSEASDADKFWDDMKISKSK